MDINSLNALTKAVSEVDENLLEKGVKGAGSRGGKVIGHTKSGKPIYESHDHAAHKDFDRHDHLDAAATHRTHQNSDDVQGEAKAGKMDRLNHHATEGGKHHSTSTKQFIGEMQSDKKDVKKSEDEGEQMDELLKTMRELGPEGLKKAAAKLNEKQKGILLDVLAKAKDMTKPEQMSDNKKPQKAKEPKTEEVSNSEEGVDEADEKLMDDSNKTQDHQGGSADKPEGWEGQVIKSEEVAAPVAEVKVESEEEKLAKSDIMCKMVERMRKRGMDRPKCLEAMKKKGYDHQMADKMWQDQEASDKVEEAPSVEAVKEEPKKEEPQKMQKSIVWGDPQAALHANTLGRNYHVSAEASIIESFERREEFKKSNETFQGGATEILQKSGERKTDINDLIEKSMDRNEMQVYNEALSLTQAPATVQSFSEDDLVKAFDHKMQSKMKKLSNKPEKSDEEQAKEKEAKDEQKASGDDQEQK